MRRSVAVPARDSNGSSLKQLFKASIHYFPFCLPSVGTLLSGENIKNRDVLKYTEGVPKEKCETQFQQA